MTMTEDMDKLTITRSHMTFLLPFSFDQSRRKEIMNDLEGYGYHYYKIDKCDSYEEQLYGYGIRVSGKELEQYFYPFIEHKLFPVSVDEKGFQRFSVHIQKTYQLQLREKTTEFTVRSIDITFGPFGIAFMALRLEISDMESDLSDVLDFIQHFRAIEPNLMENKGSRIFVPGSDEALTNHAFLFDHLCPYLKKTILHDKELKGYFGSLPYFEDERMFVSAFLITAPGSRITEEHLFRIGNLNGRSPSGKPFISSTNPAYIEQYLAESLHDRWAPYLYMIATDHTFSTISNRPADELSHELSNYMGTHYYNFLLHYFYKIMLLRVSFEYSKIEWKKDEFYVKSLIKLITLFSSWYYFKEVSTRSEGKELSSMFRNAFNIDSLFSDVNNTLQELYKSQENSQAGKLNILLFILTIFTVISGIYGMNLVIPDWEAPSGWKEYPHYTLFEWISLITAVSGIGLSGYLIVMTFGRVILRLRRKSKFDIHE